MKFFPQFPTAAKSGRYSAMEGLRGFAVLLVFVVHFIDPVLRSILKHPPLTSENADTLLLKFIYYFKMSHHGVDIFFILSGFLIIRLIRKNSPLQYLPFIRDRFLRIYPAFIVALCVATGVFSLHFDWFPFDAKTFMLNALFLQGIEELGIPNYHVVTWSLFYEFAYYFSIPLLFLFVSPDRLRANIVLIMGLGFVLLPDSYIRFEGFLFGALIATFDDKELRGWADKLNDIYLLAAYIIVGFSKVFWAGYMHWYIGFLLITSLLFVNACYGCGLLHKLFSLQLLRWLGDISFSFYLYHTIALPLVFNHLVEPYMSGNIDALPTAIIAFVLSFILATIFAVVSFSLLERPYFAYKARSRKSPHAQKDVKRRVE